jgi:hypothetical protein
VSLEISGKIPAELLANAYRSSNGEFAWPVTSASRAVDWLANEGYAILGTELWVVRADGKVSSLFHDRGGRVSLWAMSVNRNQAEAWSAFASRAAKDAKTAIAKIDVEDICDAGDVFVNITWTDSTELA